MKKLLILTVLTAFVTESSFAADSEDNTFGGWMFTEINHDFKNGMYVTEYLEHDNYQFSRMECWYSRTTIGVKVLPWLKVDASYVPVREPGEWKHYMETDLIGSLSSGDFKVSIRERYRHGFTGHATNELRSRLKVAYSVPGTNFGVYLAPEVFTWGDEWKKTRHYVAGTYDINDWMQLECYYLYYAFRNDPAEHIIGLGLNFDL